MSADLIFVNLLMSLAISTCGFNRSLHALLIGVLFSNGQPEDPYEKGPRRD